MGSSFEAFISSSILTVRQIKNARYQKVAVAPVVSLAFPRQVANPTSNNPAMISKNQHIVTSF
jgi:hypothetical protein